LLDRVQRLDLDNYLANLEDQFEEKKEELTRIEQKLEQTRKELAAKQASTSTASAPQANPTPLRRAA
jgi:flagellar biosynthesis chaperone FliJ